MAFLSGFGVGTLLLSAGEFGTFADVVLFLMLD